MIPMDMVGHNSGINFYKGINRNNSFLNIFSKTIQPVKAESCVEAYWGGVLNSLSQSNHQWYDRATIGGVGWLIQIGRNKISSSLPILFSNTGIPEGVLCLT